MPSELDQSGQPGSNRHDQLWKIGAVVLPLSWESAGPGQELASTRELPSLTLNRRGVWHICGTARWRRVHVRSSARLRPEADCQFGKCNGHGTAWR